MKRISWIMPVAATLGLGLSLSGCKDESAPVADGRQGAEGQVAGGTISDAMLPLATVRSGNAQSAPVTSVDGGGADAAGEGADESSADESDSAPDDQGAEEPAEDVPVAAAEQEAE